MRLETIDDDERTPLHVHIAQYSKHFDIDNSGGGGGDLGRESARWGGGGGGHQALANYAQKLLYYVNVLKCFDYASLCMLIISFMLIILFMINTGVCIIKTANTSLLLFMFKGSLHFL